MRAVAVRVIEKDGTLKEISARKQIIVSGGAYCSPAILLRSGIRPQAGINCKVDIPDLGKNLIDHLVYPPGFILGFLLPLHWAIG